MKRKSINIGLCLAVASFLALAACTPGTGSDAVTLNEDGSTTVNQGDGGESINTSGQTEPGGGAGNGTGAAGSSKPTVVYMDTKYGFSVEQPSDFVVRNQSEQDLAGLTPKPVAGILFMDPVIANSEVPDEPADFEIRFYALDGATSLDGWLKANGLKTSSNSQEDFKTGNVTGVKICESTMIFPGCRYYVFGEEWVYQLTATTQEGEFMLNSFKLVP